MKTLLSVDIDWVQNPEQCKKLINTVGPIFKKNEFEKPLFCQTHKEISKIIEKQSEPIYVVNIDHHHDLQYQNSSISRVGLASGNWLGYYLMQGKVAGATWICNHNSQMDGFSNWSDAKTLEDDMISIDPELATIEKFKYDFIFVCLSPHYLTNNPSAWCAYEALRYLADADDDD
tara:strand:- start:862 stop:1386 length:525 start_codon:yes stop_codon:yes gene_type:complete